MGGMKRQRFVVIFVWVVFVRYAQRGELAILDKKCGAWVNQDDISSFEILYKDFHQLFWVRSCCDEWFPYL